MSSTEIVVKGRRFDNIAAAAKAFNLKPVTVYRRISLLPDDHDHEQFDACFDPLSRLCVAKGVEYPSLKHACEALNVKYETLLDRRSKLPEGYTQEQFDACFDPDYKDPSPTFHRKACTIKGVSYESVKAACDALRLPYKLVLSRTRRLPVNFTQEQFERCFSPNLTDPKKPIFVKGVQHESVTAACKANEIAFTTATSRLRVLPENPSQLQIDDCFTVKSAANAPKSYIVKGVEYRSVREACLILGISYDLVKSRLSRLPDSPSAAQVEACFLTEAKNYCAPVTSIRVNGVPYCNITTACEVLDLNYRVVLRKIRKLPEHYTSEQFDACFAPHTLQVRGVEYKNFTQACREMGFNQAECRRIRRLIQRLPEGYDQGQLDACFDKTNPAVASSRQLTVFGEIYPSLLAACKDLNLNYNKVRYRLALLPDDYGLVEFESCFRL